MGAQSGCRAPFVKTTLTCGIREWVRFDQTVPDSVSEPPASESAVTDSLSLGTVNDESN